MQSSKVTKAAPYFQLLRPQTEALGHKAISIQYNERTNRRAQATTIFEELRQYSK